MPWKEIVLTIFWLTRQKNAREAYEYKVIYIYSPKKKSETGIFCDWPEICNTLHQKIQLQEVPNAKRNIKCLHKSKNPMQPKDNFLLLLHILHRISQISQKNCSRTQPTILIDNGSTPRPTKTSHSVEDLRHKKEEKKKYLSTTKIPRKKLAMQNRKTHLGEKPLVALWGLLRPIRAQLEPRSFQSSTKRFQTILLRLKALRRRIEVNPSKKKRKEARKWVSSRERGLWLPSKHGDWRTVFPALFSVPFWVMGRNRNGRMWWVFCFSKFDYVFESLAHGNVKKWYIHKELDSGVCCPTYP